VRRRLYRSRTDRMLFGVAGGMADWFDLDPSVVRLVWALLILAAGIGIVLYLVAAIVIPEEPLVASGAAASGTAASGPAASGAAATGAAATDQGTAAAAGASATASDDWTARRAARRAARGEREGGGAIIFGAILIALGGWFLLDKFVNINSALLLPGVLIALGAVLVVGALRRPGAS